MPIFDPFPSSNLDYPKSDVSKETTARAHSPKTNRARPTASAKPNAVRPQQSAPDQQREGRLKRSGDLAVEATDDQDVDRQRPGQWQSGAVLWIAGFDKRERQGECAQRERLRDGRRLGACNRHPRFVEFQCKTNAFFGRLWSPAGRRTTRCH